MKMQVNLSKDGIMNQNCYPLENLALTLIISWGSHIARTFIYIFIHLFSICTLYFHFNFISCIAVQQIMIENRSWSWFFKTQTLSYNNWPCNTLALYLSYNTNSIAYLDSYPLLQCNTAGRSLSFYNGIPILNVSVLFVPI